MQWRIIFCEQPHDLAGEIGKLSSSFELVRLAADMPRVEAMALLQKAHVFHTLQKAGASRLSCSGRVQTCSTVLRMVRDTMPSMFRHAASTVSVSQISPA